MGPAVGMPVDVIPPSTGPGIANGTTRTPRLSRNENDIAFTNRPKGEGTTNTRKCIANGEKPLHGAPGRNSGLSIEGSTVSALVPCVEFAVGLGPVGAALEFPPLHPNVTVSANRRNAATETDQRLGIAHLAAVCEAKRVLVSGKNQSAASCV